MRTYESYGVLLFRNINQHLELLLLESSEFSSMPYHLSIPKGQAKHEESDLRNSAIRNLFEETGLTLSDIEWLDSIEPLQYEYKIYKDQVLSKKKVLAYYATLDKEKEIVLSQKRGNIF